MGGSLAFWVGKRKGANSVLFNPALSPFRHKSHSVHDGNHYVCRGVDDMVSLGSFRFEDKPNIDIVPLDPKKSEPHVMDAHDVDQFIKPSERRLTNAEIYENEQDEIF